MMDCERQRLGGDYSIGVYNSSSSPVMTSVSASASGGTTSYGVYNYNSSSPAMTSVSASATGGSTSYGVYNYFILLAGDDGRERQRLGRNDQLWRVQ